MVEHLARAFPVVGWVRQYRRSWAVGDLVAGLTLATLLIPQSMAYAQVARLPPVVGLYASVVPVFVYVLVGQSPQLSVGPLATISIIGAAGVAALAAPGTAEFITLSASLAVLVGLVHIACGVLRLGWLVQFLSEPVLRGFLAGAGIIVIATQLGALLGIDLPATSAHAFVILAEAADHLDAANAATVALSVGSIVVLVALKRFRRFPTMLLLVAATSVVCWALELDTEHGVAVVGDIPSGLAGFAVPPLDLHTLDVLLPAAVGITLIGFVESIALEKGYSRAHRYRVSTNQELGALGLTNVAAGFFQGMIVTGAITRSTVADDAGARTQLAGAVAGTVAALVVLFLTGALRYTPLAVLAAIVAVACAGFVKVGYARRLFSVARADFWLGLLTLACTLVLGLERGLLLTTVVSLAVVVYRVSRPNVVALGRQPGTDAFRDLARMDGDAVTTDGVVVLRVDAPLFYANADFVEEHLLALTATGTDAGVRHRWFHRGRPSVIDEARRSGPVRTVVLDCAGVDSLDSTADESLRSSATVLAERGVALYLTNVKGPVRDVMDASGFTAQVGEDHFFPTDLDAERALGGGTRPDPPPAG